MADGYGPPRVDFSWLQNLPASIEGGAALGRQYRLRNAFNSPEVKKAIEQGDFNTLARILAPLDQEAALKTMIAGKVKPRAHFIADPLGRGTIDADTGQLVSFGSAGGGEGGEGASAGNYGAPNPYWTPTKNADQSKAVSYFQSGQSADEIISELGSTVNTEGVESRIARHIPQETGFGLVGDVAASFVNVDAAKLDNAARRFVNSINRRESGATVTPSELKEAYELYIPKKNDPDELIAQKTKNRRERLQSLAGEAGPMFNPNANPPPLGVEKRQPTPAQQQLYMQHKNEPGFLEEWNRRFPP